MSVWVKVVVVEVVEGCLFGELRGSDLDSFY
jgi:hypothetical protein